MTPECADERITRALEELEKGFSRSWIRVKTLSLEPGRFKGLYKTTLLLEAGGSAARVASLMVFCGRPPFYRPWAEVFNINPDIPVERGGYMPFTDTRLEDVFLDAVTLFSPPGSAFYIEYNWDEETTRELDMGVPAPASRLGYKLFQRGFTWFKVWYHPEGFLEGGQKIQAEKPLTADAKVRQLESLRLELEGFLKVSEREPGLYKARLRARRVLKDISVHLARG